MQCFVSNAKKVFLKSKKCAYKYIIHRNLILWVVFTIICIFTRKNKAVIVQVCHLWSFHIRRNINFWRKLFCNMLATYPLLLVLPQFRLLFTSVPPVPVPHGSCVTALAPLHLPNCSGPTALAHCRCPLPLPHCPCPPWKKTSKTK